MASRNLNDQLYDAVERNDVNEAKELLKRGGDVNSRGGLRLVCFTMRMYVFCFKMITKHDSDVDVHCFGTSV